MLVGLIATIRPRVPARLVKHQASGVETAGGQRDLVPQQVKLTTNHFIADFPQDDRRMIPVPGTICSISRVQRRSNCGVNTGQRFMHSMGGAPVNRMPISSARSRTMGNGGMRHGRSRLNPAAFAIWISRRTRSGSFGCASVEGYCPSQNAAFDEERFAVEMESSVAHRELAHSEPDTMLVERLSLHADDDACRVEMG